MHTVKIELSPAEATSLEEKLLELANERGKPLNFSILLLPRRAAIMTGYFKTRAESLAQLRLIGMEKRAHHGFLRDHDWQDSVKKHFKPLVYRRVAWLPVWQKKFDRKKAKADVVLKFDIGMAFGTGNHPTTRLCLRRLVELMEKYNCPNILDAGCGSGILAITADKLGAGKTTGFDLDEQSIIVAKRNAKINRSRAVFKFGDLYKNKLPTADIVLGNLLGNLITDNAKRLWKTVNRGGVLVLSGLLKEELESIAKLFPAPAKHYRLGKWGALVIMKG